MKELDKLLKKRFQELIQDMRRLKYYSHSVLWADPRVPDEELLGIALAHFLGFNREKILETIYFLLRRADMYYEQEEIEKWLERLELEELEKLEKE
jgi:hypothetical protein